MRLNAAARESSLAKAKEAEAWVEPETLLEPRPEAGLQGAGLPAGPQGPHHSLGGPGRQRENAGGTSLCLSAVGAVGKMGSGRSQQTWDSLPLGP